MVKNFLLSRDNVLQLVAMILDVRRRRREGGRMKRRKGKERRRRKRRAMLLCPRQTVPPQGTRKLAKTTNSIVKFTLGHEATTKVSSLKQLGPKINLNVPSPRYTWKV